MESNGYEHQLFKAIEALSIIASQAYWKDRKDCGSDFNERFTCPDCQYFEVCKANEALKKAINTLQEWNC